jgi:antitoxin ParD1/3/4
VRSVQSRGIILPHEMVEMIRSKVAAGEYASESEVVRDGAFEDWLKTETALAYDEFNAEPEKAIPVADIMGCLKAQYRARTGQNGQP